MFRCNELNGGLLQVKKSMKRRIESVATAAKMQIYTKSGSWALCAARSCCLSIASYHTVPHLQLDQVSLAIEFRNRNGLRTWRM